VAVHLSDDLKRALGKLQERLRRQVDGNVRMKWVEPRSMHLTLQFLGDLDPGLVPKLADSLRGAFPDVPPFELEALGAGAFPGPAHPRVLWAGLSRGADELRVLAAACLAVTGALGIPAEERPFRPHITLARIRAGSRPADLGGPLQALTDAPIGRCQIDRVYLMKSELRPSGPLHSVLDSFPLGR
jgi:2'-5' RNA ligase